MFQCMMEETSIKGDDVVKLFLVISISLKPVWVKLVAREPLCTVGNLLSLSMTVVDHEITDPSSHNLLFQVDLHSGLRS